MHKNFRFFTTFGKYLMTRKAVERREHKCYDVYEHKGGNKLGVYGRNESGVEGSKSKFMATKWNSEGRNL